MIAQVKNSCESVNAQVFGMYLRNYFCEVIIIWINDEGISDLWVWISVLSAMLPISYCILKYYFLFYA